LKKNDLDAEYSDAVAEGEEEGCTTVVRLRDDAACFRKSSSEAMLPLPVSLSLAADTEDPENIALLRDRAEL